MDLLSKLVEKLEKRSNEIESWLYQNDPTCFKEQKHLDETLKGPTSERIYWHYGYWAALHDVHVQLAALRPVIEKLMESATVVVETEGVSGVVELQAALESWRRMNGE